MTRAEEASLKAYPLPTLERITTDVYADARKNFQEGYEQAEKDYAKLKELADNMYSAAQYLTDDASRLHKAMEEYKLFVVYEYNKKEEN